MINLLVTKFAKQHETQLHVMCDKTKIPSVQMNLTSGVILLSQALCALLVYARDKYSLRILTSKLTF